MTLSELIDHLEELREEAGDSDPEVRIAYQPTWPLRASIANLALAEDEKLGGDTHQVLWIAASPSGPYNENPYAPSSAWEPA